MRVEVLVLFWRLKGRECTLKLGDGVLGGLDIFFFPCLLSYRVVFVSSGGEWCRSQDDLSLVLM